MDSHLANLLRRSRGPHQRAAAANLKSSLEKKSMDHALDKRLTPEQLSVIQAANSRAAATTAAVSIRVNFMIQADLQTSAAVTANPATPVGAATQAVGGVASRIQSSSAVASSTVVRSSATPISSAAPTTSSARPTSTVVTSARAISSSSVSIFSKHLNDAHDRLLDRPALSPPARPLPEHLLQSLPRPEPFHPPHRHCHRHRLCQVSLLPLQVSHPSLLVLEQVQSLESFWPSLSV